MDDSNSRKANSYLQAESRELHSVFAKIRELDALNRALTTYLDLNLVKYCQVANRIGNKLILLVANGSVATQLRFQTSELLLKFKHDPVLQAIKEIQCKVRPATTQRSATPKPSQPMLPLSLETAEIVRGIAQSVEDPHVKAALEKIANRTKEPTSS